jgi:hypothetical protein
MWGGRIDAMILASWASVGSVLPRHRHVATPAAKYLATVFRSTLVPRAIPARPPPGRAAQHEKVKVPRRCLPVFGPPSLSGKLTVALGTDHDRDFSSRNHLTPNYAPGRKSCAGEFTLRSSRPQ